MANYDTYYITLKDKDKQKAIDIAKRVPSITIGYAAKIYIQCGGNKAAIARYLKTHYGITYGGDGF